MAIAPDTRRIIEDNLAAQEIMYRGKECFAYMSARATDVGRESRGTCLLCNCRTLFQVFDDVISRCAWVCIACIHKVPRQGVLKW